MTVRVAGVVPWLVMKGMALAERIKEKDAYDIVYCVRNYPGGIPALVQVCRPHLSHGLVREGFGKIRRHFQSVEHLGPRLVAEFEAVTDLEARDLIRRAAYEEVRQWLDALDVPPWVEP